MPITAKEMVKLLKQNGFEEVSQKGSHLKMINKETKQQVIIPMHNKDLGKGLENKILKDVGLK